MNIFEVFFGVVAITDIIPRARETWYQPCIENFQPLICDIAVIAYFVWKFVL